MNQELIGKFIASERHSKGLTQEELACKLGISDRAVSKWERGINIPDASLMMELSSMFGITVNELLSGRRFDNSEYMKEAESNLIELQKVNEEQTKKLLMLEMVIGFIVTISFLTTIFTIIFVDMIMPIRIILFLIGLAIFIVGISYCILIEQVAGYYECNKCHERYVPTYKQVLFAMHNGRTRYMKCPKCHKYSWNKKVIK